VPAGIVGDHEEGKRILYGVAMDVSIEWVSEILGGAGLFKRANHGRKAADGAAGIAAGGPPKRIIGLGLDEDLWRHRGTGAITYLEGNWQRAGLTTIPVWRLQDRFKDMFKQAAMNADEIRFDLTSFKFDHIDMNLTHWELQQIVKSPKLLEKTTFIMDGKKVFWNGSTFDK
jgi:hypothetical protein